MAILYNRSGQYAKGQAMHEVVRYQLYCMVVVLAGGITGGLSFWSILIKWRPFATFFIPHAALIVTGVSLITSGVVFWLMRRMNIPLEECWRERVKWLRGGQGEAYVTWLLKDDLPNDWHIFNNVLIRDNWDVDHVVVGPRGVFCISTKAERGLYSRAATGSILLNGQPCAYVDEAVQMALKLKDRLEALTGHNAPWIQPVLAAPLAHVGFHTQSQRAWVVHEENIVATLLDSTKRLKRAEIDSLIEVLQGLIASSVKSQPIKPIDVKAVDT